ncbi:MAG: hypothetical protein A3G84_06955 [Chloroflexi bacterium RIFCSPLOWO2_12_FULL_71_12]|nr:MAG: hypothetical protein A3G84_06955 [Chloroflexi bacterium RIFCSPLOWO2_12_FULL_71_12]
MFTMTKLAAGTVAGVLSVALTGAVAFAAFQPAEGVATAATVGQPAQERGTERPEGKGQVRALAAILEAVGTAAHREARVKRIWAGLMRVSVEYLGLPRQDVGAALRAGTSLGELADDTDGKSRDGLIDTLAQQVTERIDQALADGTITEEQADKAEEDLVERITRFVDHEYDGRVGGPGGKKTHGKPRA